MKRILFVIVLCLAVSGCSRWKQIVEKPVYIHDTVESSHYIHDSIFKHDSTFVMLKGDTVFIDRTHTEFRYKYITDTLNVYKEVPVEVVVTKETAKPLNWFQKTFIGLGIISLLALIAYIVFKIFKRKVI